ncbi:ATP-binding cassette domain-containing protein [Paracoccus zhejiangensis]|uniref:ABC transporter ATP-binding protein n=1 Tax=Paracoccus zhejiangensis TaxID=1077935 RepID=A0A2H5F2G4_9RHOB|nr:ATP-binding cassette domain-containing protein [Paracoccus zhejiangensis]AUH65748.1 ABC transporter ATP-binding protein [Paracoccus zhejiangensis]
MSDLADRTVLRGRDIPAVAQPARAPVLPLSLRGVTLQLAGQTILDALDLDLGTRGCTVIMGPNGTGKSLLLKLLHGLILPTSGQIRWGALPPAEVTARQSLVFQKPMLLRRSVAANLDFVLQARGKDRGRGDALLDHVGLRHKSDQPARQLSGGEAQRLGMARALATDPDVLLMDEPTASLDPASTLAIETIMTEARSSGIRVILVTHDVGQAKRMADDVVFLHRGRIAEHRAAPDFFARPDTEAARDFLQGNLVL